MTDQERDDKIREIHRLSDTIAEGQLIMFLGTLSAITFATIIICLMMKSH